MFATNGDYPPKSPFGDPLGKPCQRGTFNIYSASRWCRYMLHLLYKSAASATSPLYKAKGAFFLHELATCSLLIAISVALSVKALELLLYL